MRTLLLTSVLTFLLAACASSPKETGIPPEALYAHVDSTMYFAQRTASVSMRATFNRQGRTSLVDGYKFQFRSIDEKPAFLNSVSIIAGGKRIFLEEGQIVLPTGQGVTLQLSLEDSNFIAAFPSALLQFRHNRESQIYAIELHQLQEFSP